MVVLYLHINCAKLSWYKSETLKIFNILKILHLTFYW